jgi:glycosyltransferase involved in cell wall biosynthesis
VLLVLDSLAPGGAERSTVSLLPHLIERGFRLDLAVLHDRRADDTPTLHETAAAVVPVHVLDGPGGRPGWIGRTRQLIRSLRPDLVHTSLFEADVCGRTAAVLTRTPAVSTLPTERYGDAHLNAPHLRPAKVRAAQAIDIATVRGARRLHAVSNHVADTMAAHLRFPRSRIDVVYRGRPVPESRPDEAGCRTACRHSLDLADRPTVLMTARHEQAKGIDRALVAMKPLRDRHPDAVLLVAGRDGGQTAELRRLANGAGLAGTVRFLGHRDDLDDLYRAADVFVLPSRREGLPGSLLEAMAVGLPAVVNGLPQVREVVDDDQARIVDANDPTALASALSDVLCDRAGSEAMAARAADRFMREFTIDRSADGMAAFYHRSLADD